MNIPVRFVVPGGFKAYVNKPLPPAAVIVMLPVLFPKHKIFVVVTFVILGEAGLVIAITELTVQALASIAVTV